MTKPFNTFTDIASAPFWWWMKADDLFSAADAIFGCWQAAQQTYFDGMPDKTATVKLTPQQQDAFRRLRFGWTYLFIAGLALENSIKGLLIARDPTLVADKRLSEKITTGHKLLPLFNMAGIALSAEETQLVERLSDSIQWAGRYPSPLKEADWKLEPLPNGGGYLPGTPFAADDDRVNNLRRRLLEIIEGDPAAPKYSTLGP